MNHLVLAVFLLTMIGPMATAQDPPSKPADPVPKPADPAPKPKDPAAKPRDVPTYIPIPVVPPRTGYYKAGPVLVGADGRYPFDTGEQNLSGDLGNFRTWGTFSMVLPNGEVFHNPIPVHPVPYPIPVYPRHQWFRRN